MYRSRPQVTHKLAEVRYILRQLLRFRGRVFERDGFDEKTGAKPVRIHFASFLAHARSILQYAHREAGQRGRQQAYDDEVSKYPIFKCFRELRDSEIHEYSPQVSVRMFATATIASYNPTNGVARTKPFAIRIESLDAQSSPSVASEVRVEYHISVQVDPTPELLADLKERGQHDLADSAAGGKPVYKLVEFEGMKDLFPLCERYVDALESFVQGGTARGFIT